MFAQLVMLTLGPNMRSTGEELAEKFAPALRAAKGFKRVTFFGNDEVGEYGSLSIWETKEDVMAAATLLQPNLEKAVSGIAKSPPTRRFYEVYEPRVTQLPDPGGM